MFTPQRFGKYFLFDRLAVGGMAEVFKAKLLGVETSETIYALKRIHPHHMENKDFVSMLIDEAKISVQLEHGNVIQVVDIGRVGDQCFICMEFIEGKDMRQVFDRCRESGQEMAYTDAVHVVSEVCKGLGYAHAMLDKAGQPLNIIHRDVSPQNVLVSFDGDVKLIDFGIAKAAGRLMETQVGILKGKYAYMSPEQATGKSIDKRTDIFAAGVLLYEATVRTHPFRAPHDLETLRNIKDGKYVAPAEANPDLPPSLCRVIETALENRAEDRYSTAEEMANALDRVLNDMVTRYKSTRLADFVQGLFADEVMVRGRSASEASKLEREFLTGEFPGAASGGRRVPSNEQATAIRGNGQGAGANGASSGTAVGPPPGARQPQNRPPAGGAVRMGVQPVREPEPQVFIEPARREVGLTGPGLGDRMMTGDLTQNDSIGLAAFSVIAIALSLFMLAWHPRGDTRPIALNTNTPIASPTPFRATPTEAAVSPTREPVASPTKVVVSSGPATLKIRSQPKAFVSINGKPLGETPLNITDVRSGATYSVVLSAPGYGEWSGKVTPGAGEDVLIRETLKAVPTGYLTLVTIPPGAKVLVDGKPYPGATPLTLTLAAGERVIKVYDANNASKHSTFKKRIRAQREYNETIDLRLK